MILRRVYDDSLAQASYLVGSSNGDALIIDPNRDVNQYIALAETLGLRIVAVAETHIHADFVSGARDLSTLTGARLMVSDAGHPEWKYAFAEQAGATLLHDGDIFQIGELSIRAKHTPGHTPEHLAYLLSDTATTDQPMGIFTGDFVFVGDVGRPDLLETAVGIAGSKDESARQLHRSLQRFRTLPEYVQVWPGHGAGSACGKALGNVPQTTVGYELRFNWAFAVREEDEFVRRVLDGLGEPPRYFARMKHVNQQGPAPLASLSRPRNLAPDSIGNVLATGTLVVDTRPAHAYGAGHIPGTLNIPAGPALVTWAGALLPYDQPLAFISESEQAESITTRLRLIGFDDIDGYWTPEALHAWETHGRALETVQLVDPSSLSQLIEEDAVTVLDVRERAEYQAGHIPSSVNIPLGQIERRIGELPASRPLAVHCQGGTRSAIAASLLQRQGRTDILDLSAGFRGWHAEGEPVEDDARTPISVSG